MILNSYFEKFVSNIQPTKERVDAISDAHSTLRKHLKEDATLKYPVDSSFLSGSYARYTAVNPVKDADIILILEENDVSEDKKEPDPHAVLEDLRVAIEDFYDDVNLETQRRSIQVYLEEDDVRMDIVPSIAPSGKEEPINVPDYEQKEWIDSHPYGHIKFATETNKDSDRKFVRIAKAMKWWKIENLAREKAPKSFLLETIVARNIRKDAENLCVCFEETVKNILDAYKDDRYEGRVPKVVDPGIETNDLSETCGWTYDEFEYFYGELEKLHQTAVSANNEETEKARTIDLWQSLFGDSYPSSLTEAQEKSAEASMSNSVPAARSTYQYTVVVSATWHKNRNGLPIAKYPSDGFKLQKDQWLKFTIDAIDVPEPYEIIWQVTNHGKEARDDRGLRHQTFGHNTHWESTRYRGHHFMDCIIRKDGATVAKTRYVVNIGSGK